MKDLFRKNCENEMLILMYRQVAKNIVYVSTTCVIGSYTETNVLDRRKPYWLFLMTFLSHMT